MLPRCLASFSWKFRPELTLVGGLRLEYEERKLDGLTTGFIAPPVVFVPPTDRNLITREPSGKVALEYRPRTGVMAYASASRGIKSGGFTAYNTTNVAQLAAFRPEVLNAYEIGAKTELSSSLRANLAVYHYDYRNQQVLSTVYDIVSEGPIGRIANAERSRIDGGEVELAWRPMRGLELNQYMAIKDGAYNKFIAVDAQASIAEKREVSADFSNTSLGVPRTSLGGSATYTRVLGRNLLRGGVSYSYRDREIASRLIFTSEYDVPPYALLNANFTWARAGFSMVDRPVGRNIADRRYDVTRNFFINAKVAAAGQPATLGVRVSYTR